MKQTKLLLTTNVDNLGIVGDVVSVKPGFARNYLFPRGMATDPTDGNIARLAAERQRVEQELAEKRVVQEQILEKLEGYEITLQRTANEQGALFGGVTQHDIAELLRADGFDIDDRAVRIGDTIKRLDTYDIPVILSDNLKTEIKVWVVSDKPTEALESETAANEGSDDDMAGSRAEESASQED